MAAKTSTLNVDIGTRFQAAAAQFRGLNMNEPGQWPTLPKVAAGLVVVIAAVEVGAPLPAAVALFEIVASFKSSCEIV